MKRTSKHSLRLAVVALLLTALGGCAVVPYGAPGYYDGYRGYSEPVYGPAVVPVPVPVWGGGYYGCHRGYYGHRHHRW